ncbi:MAG: NnrU family protein [Alphaproteobacteria bacterium]|nr:NnrU family protein [Alphaproteobacteria bacterium]
MEGIFPLLMAAVFWIATHNGFAGTDIRTRLAGKIGENGFRIVYAIISVIAIMMLARAWEGAVAMPVWTAPAWLRLILALIMLPAFLFFIAGFLRNPTAVGGEAVAGQQIRGIQRITRHPMLWSFALWALVHVIGNGDVASLIFFGTFAISAFLGMPSIDRKLAARSPGAAAKLRTETSILPFGAIMAGRNRLVLAEIGWLAPLLAVIGWAAMLHFHARLFGVPALLHF